MRLVDLIAVAAFEQPDVDALLRDRIEEIGEHDAGDARRAEHRHDPHRQAGDEDEHEPGRGEDDRLAEVGLRSEEHTSELQSLMRISYAVFCLKKTNI